MPSSGSLASIQRPPRAEKSEVISVFLEIYLKEEKWSEAQPLLIRKMALDLVEFLGSMVRACLICSHLFKFFSETGYLESFGEVVTELQLPLKISSFADGGRLGVPCKSTNRVNYTPTIERSKELD
jgi:hypothetical protein